MATRDRTAYWVQTYSSGDVEFYSPSIPPSELDDYSPSTPSDTGSSHSIPPRMVLRYDGRPDLPVPRTGDRFGRHNARSYDKFDPRSHYDARAHGNGPYASPPFAEVQSRRYPDQVLFNAPEQIRVLPATGSHVPPRSRANSLPRSELPPLPQHILPLPPSGAYPPVSHGSAPRAPSRHSRSEVHGHSPRVAQTSGAFYRPVNGYHRPSQIAPNSVIYSHSAPPVLMRHGTTAHPRTGGPEQRRVMPDGRMGVERSRSSRARSVSMSGHRPKVVDRSDTSSDSETETSYYGSRSRTKTPISTPSSGKSVATATSSRSPITPTSTVYGKRPFFQRLFHFAGKLSHGGPSRVISVSEAGDLHRRHSVGGPRH